MEATKQIAKGAQERLIKRFNDGKFSGIEDIVAEEAPFEIQLNFWDGNVFQTESLAITMRTPGKDEELAIGFLITEGIIQDQTAIRKVLAVDENILMIGLHKEIRIDWSALSRHFYMTSSCGVCGKSSIDQVQSKLLFNIEQNNFSIAVEVLQGLQNKLLGRQSLFTATGGIHAAALFDHEGGLLMMHEDVGRHNALDKLIGAAVQSYGLPLEDKFILVSGRASFELVQKTGMSGVPMLVAIGAPSTLAIDLATANGIGLIGFLKNNKFNCYSNYERIIIKEDQ